MFWKLKMITQIQNYLATTLATRTTIKRLFKINDYQLRKLESQGLKLPKPLTPSQAAKVGRKTMSYEFRI